METNEIAIIENKVSEAVSRANALVVAKAEDYQRAVDLSLTYKRLEKEIVETFKPLKQQAKATHDAIIAQERKHLDPVKEVQRIVDSKAVVWFRAEQARQEEDRRQRETAARKAEEERRLAEAEHAEKQGDKGLANAILDAPLPTLAVPRAPDPKVSGFTVTSNWTFEVTDPNIVPREYLVVDETKVRQVVRALKDKTNIAGIRVFAVDSTRKVTR